MNRYCFFLHFPKCFFENLLLAWSHSGFTQANFIAKITTCVQLSLVLQHVLRLHCIVGVEASGREIFLTSVIDSAPVVMV